MGDVTNLKLRGGYYTPPAIADFLSTWAVQSPDDTILEPSCGDGALLTAAATRLLRLGTMPETVGCQLHGVELYETEAAKAASRLAQLGAHCPASVTPGDFFEVYRQTESFGESKFDVVLGNPPFLRYHSFPAEQRDKAFGIMRTAGMKPTKLTNSWVAFLIASSLLLTQQGRLAMVLPAELLQVKYAAETRRFLARHFGAITIITFRRLVFDGIQQEVVLLLAEKSPRIESGIDVIELGDADDLADYEFNLRGRHHLKTIDHAEEKWTQYYLEESEIALLRVAKRHPEWKPFAHWGCVDVGVVTGDNSFFVMTDAEARAHKLSEWTLPLVGRTAQLPGLVLSEEEWERGRTANARCHLLNLPSLAWEELPVSAQEYVRSGEARDAHAGYKCRIRKPWYAVPTLWSPDAFLFRQIHEYPKMVVNAVGATSTDTIHRVRFHQSLQTKQFAITFHNSMTFAFSEVMGRSYGGGVLELEPNEAEELPLPFYTDTDWDFERFDRLERERQIEAMLDITDREILQGRMGFTRAETAMFRQIWRKLSGRRLGRKTKVKCGGVK